MFRSRSPGLPPGSDMNTPHSHLLCPPALNNTASVTGQTTPALRKENKRRSIDSQRTRTHSPQWWKHHTGDFTPPPPLPPVPNHINNMCARGLALHHPAGVLLTNYATLGCPTETGQPWTLEMMQAAIDRGPHKSTLHPDATGQLHLEVAEKVKKSKHK